MPMPTSSRAVVFMLGTLTTILVGWVLHVGAGILQPLVIALLLASMLQPVVRSLARWKIPPAFTVIFLTTLLFGGMFQLGILLQSGITSFLGDPKAPRITVPVGGSNGRTQSVPPAVVVVQPARPQLELPGGGELNQSGDSETDPNGVDSESQSAQKAEGAQTESGSDQLAGMDSAEDSEASEQPALDSEDGETLTGEELANATGTEQGDSEAEDSSASESDEGVLDRVLGEQEQLGRDVGGWDGVVERINERMRSSTSLPTEVVEYVTETLRETQLKDFAAGVIGSGFDFTKGGLLVFIYMLFIFAEQAVFRRKILAIAGSKQADTARVLDTIARGIQRYLGVKTVTSIATGALCYAVLVSLQIPYALLFGFLTFLLNYIPTFGSIMAGSLPTITALAVDPHWGKAAIVVVTYLAVNLTLGSFIEPKILGRELNLSPLVIIVSVVVWAGLWGVVGTFLAVPLTAAIQIILASQENTRPIAVMLSSGPPKEALRRGRKRKKPVPENDPARRQNRAG